MRDRPPPPMIAGPMLRSGRLVRTTAPLAGSPARGATVSVGFTPGGAWTDALVQRPGRRPSHRVMAAPIAQALVEAHRWGVRVDVRLETDTRTEPYAGAGVLAKGVPPKRDAEHAMAQNNVTGIDGEAVITERGNFTTAVQAKKAENVLFIGDKAWAAGYTQNWHAHAQHSQPYVGRGVRQ
jgi:hypothetical protein